jgi:hypothetical protein
MEVRQKAISGDMIPVQDAPAIKAQASKSTE